jgi:hypothetical protein
LILLNDVKAKHLYAAGEQNQGPGTNLNSAFRNGKDLNG